MDPLAGSVASGGLERGRRVILATAPGLITSTFEPALVAGLDFVSGETAGGQP